LLQSHDDWGWLIKKFEKRLDHWCNRWLTLGGRLVLIKAVLVSQPVFWMSMVAIPSSILERLRQLIYTFLWSGGKEKKRIHLCNWDNLARPKKAGGWGIKNLVFFNKALAEKSLWRGLSTEGIWKKVIKDKYLPYVSVSRWFRLETRSQGDSSPVWRNLLKSKPLLDHWLCWKTGNGCSYTGGRDQLMGLGINSFLSDALLNS
jgi:hypothetical protein